MNQVYLKDKFNSHEIRNNTEFPIYKIVITGGPCAGKTTSLEKIKKEMSEKGYRVFSVPEIPTMVVVAGGMILMSKFNTHERIHFQSLLMRFQMYAEDYFTKLAEMSKSPSIVLCDRGVVDPYAYVSKEEFQAIMDEEGWSWVTLRDRRYDRVIFLSSAACGAEDYYTLDNNVARSEGIEVARHLNQRTLEAWTGHPHLTIVANNPKETFDDKINAAVKAVEKTVGLEQVNVSYEKYLLKEPVFPADLKVEYSEIEEAFLVNEDQRYEEDKIKRRGQNNAYTYQRKYRTKKDQNGDCAQEIRKPLTSLQYVTLKEQSLDQNYNVVQRRRANFVYNNISFAIDIYPEINGEKNVHLLRFNSQVEKPESLIPEFLECVKNVKKDKSFGLREISKKKL
jgi:thymidylate kinase